MMGCRWLEAHVCVPGLVVLAVQSPVWLEAVFNRENARITTSKTDYLFMLDVPAVQALPSHPTADQLVGVARH